MNDLTPFEYERIVISYLLIYKEAANFVLPDLTHDKFIHSVTGRLDGRKDHRDIWQAMTHLHLVEKLPLTASTIVSRLGEEGNGKEMLAYLASLETSFANYYRIREFNPAELMSYAEKVFTSGTIYQASIKSYKLAKLVDNLEEFAKAVNGIEDVSDFLRSYIGDLSSLTTFRGEGYTHISNSVEKTKALAEQVYRGDQVMLLPTGLPSIKLPTGKLVLLMGESNSGKSVITHQICLGTAIGLKRYNVPGCVAVNSLEEREEPFTLKLASMLAGVNNEEFLYGMGITPREKYRLDKALEYVASLPLYLDTTNRLATSVLDFRLTGLHASDKGPVHLMSVDYLGRLDLDAEKGNTEQENIDKAINHFADIIGETGLTALVITQITQGNSGNAKARIAGPDGTRGSRSSRFAADIMWEWWNPVEMKKSGTDFAVPERLNAEQPWLLNPKTRFGAKKEPIAFGWQPEYQRVFDLELNREGNPEIVLFSHPLPSFEMVEAGVF